MDGEGVRNPEEGFGLREEEGVVTEALGEDLREVFKNFFLTIVFEDEEVPISVGVEGSEVAKSVGSGATDVVGEGLRDTESRVVEGVETIGEVNVFNVGEEVFVKESELF